MKNLYTTLILFVFTALLTGCNAPLDEPEYKSPENFRDDVAVFADFSVRKQSIILTYLKITSDEFTKNILEGTVSQKDYDDFFAEVSNMTLLIEDYEMSFKKLEDSNVLTDVTLKGIISSGKSFFTWLSGSGERSRERIITVASNLDSKERTKLYKSLRTNWKEKTSNEDDFWKKLEKGDFDVQAPQMFNDFQIENEEFAITSDEKGLTIQRIVVLEGAAGVKAGSEFMVDVVGTATPLGKGMTAVQVAQNTADLYNAKSNAERKKIVTTLLSNLASLAWQDPILGIIGGDAAVDIVAESITETVDIVKKDGSNIEGTNKSIVIVQDSDSKDNADIVIAQKQGSSSPGQASIYVSIGNAISEGTEFIYTILNKGKWTLSAIDESGNKETKLVDVPAGEVIYITVETLSTESEGDDNDEPTVTSEWKNLCSKYPYLNHYPPYPSSFTFFTYRDNDYSFYTGEEVVIKTKTSNADNYQKKLQDYGYLYNNENGGIITYQGPNYGEYYSNIAFMNAADAGYSNINFNILKMISPE